MNEHERNAWLAALRRDSYPHSWLEEPPPDRDLDYLVDEALRIHSDPEKAARVVACELSALGVGQQLHALHRALPAYVAARAAGTGTD